MKKRKLCDWFLLLVILLLIILLFVYYILFKNYNFTIDCLFHKITGLYCPGCGVTRLLFSLVKLDFYQAFRYNMLIFVFLPFILYLLVDYVIKRLIFKNNYVYKKVSNKVWLILLVILLLFGVLRNIPVFDFLKPTDIM